MNERGPKTKADIYGRLLSDKEREEMLIKVVYTDDECFHPATNEEEKPVETETKTEP